MQIDEKFNLFENVRRAVDLCAAPGSWSQVLSKKLYEENEDRSNVQIVAVDLQDMAPLEGVIQVKGDITKESTSRTIIDLFHGQKADLIICDGAPDVTGMHDVDEYVQAQLLLSAMNITTHLLTEGGTFVAKIFRGKDTSLLYSQFKVFFSFVEIAKPKSSRNSSIESFIVCKNFKIPEGYKTSISNPFFNQSIEEEEESYEKLLGLNRIIIPFVVCGDLSGYDADENYSIKEEKEYITPSHPPINPPYQKAKEMKKTNKY